MRNEFYRCDNKVKDSQVEQEEGARREMTRKRKESMNPRYQPELGKERRS